MTQEEKQLLLKDLCARLPYVPIIRIEEHDWCNLHIDAYDTPFRTYYLEPFIIEEIEFKPYLRPMSSMTEEEHMKLKAAYDNGSNGLFDEYSHIDWLISHHFDYRRLIEKGLALEAPKNMYKTE